MPQNKLVSASLLKNFFSAGLIVSALGYFVDVFDLYLFSILRKSSLQDLGLSGEELTQAGFTLLNAQMFGMLAGGIFWGILGDKKGRLSVLFGSILLYSIANIANAFVHDVTAYALCRLIAGIGLAGELGAGITLVAESLPQRQRSLGTTFMASIGLAGAVAAALIADMFPWRTTYMIGGFLGLALLIARGIVYESGLFQKNKTRTSVKRGKFLALFTNPRRLRYYLSCILIGVPTWFIAGIMLTLAPEIAAKMHIPGEVSVSYAVLAYSIMLTLGDVISGLLSHFCKTRKKVILAFLSGLGATLLCFFICPPKDLFALYVFYGAMGFFIGNWAVLLTMTAELFGTNLRASATSTVPNFIRGSTVLLNLGVAGLAGLGFMGAIEAVGAIVMILAILCALGIPETYHHHLDFNEKI